MSRAAERQGEATITPPKPRRLPAAWRESLVAARRAEIPPSPLPQKSTLAEGKARAKRRAHLLRAAASLAPKEKNLPALKGSAGMGRNTAGGLEEPPPYSKKPASKKKAKSSREKERPSGAKRRMRFGLILCDAGRKSQPERERLPRFNLTFLETKRRRVSFSLSLMRATLPSSPLPLEESASRSKAALWTAG